MNMNLPAYINAPPLTSSNVVNSDSCNQQGNGPSSCQKGKANLTAFSSQGHNQCVSVNQLPKDVPAKDCSRPVTFVC